MSFKSPRDNINSLDSNYLSTHFGHLSTDGPKGNSRRHGSEPPSGIQIDQADLGASP